MPIQFCCPACRKAYVVPDKHAGKKTYCKACRSPISIPAAVPALGGLEAIPALEPELDVAPPPRELPPARLVDRPRGRVAPIKYPAGRPGGSEGPAFSAAGVLKHPGFWGAIGAIVLVTLLLTSQSAAAAVGMLLIVVGAFCAILLNLYFSLSMYKAVWQERGILPILGLFVPIVSLFVAIWMLINYWEYAKRAFASVIVGVILILGGVYLTSPDFQQWQMRAAAESKPVYEDLPTPTLHAPGVHLYDVRIGGSGPGTGMRVSLYMPAGDQTPAAKLLPCILIAPAGTTMLTGIRLGAEDAKEHLAYVRHGYAVAAFDLDGPVSEDPSAREMVNAIRAFRSARYGVVNAQHAIQFLLEKVPAINPEQLFAVGHSSAGGFALNLAAADRRIKAVVAYAPSTDILGRQPAALFQALGRHMRDIKEVAKEAAPLTHVAEIGCPVFLFHSSEDTVVTSAEVQRYADALKSAGKTVEVKTVATGDHYHAMIAKGIPQGIAWLHAFAPTTTMVAEAPVRAPEPVAAAPMPTAAAPERVVPTPMPMPPRATPESVVPGPRVEAGERVRTAMPRAEEPVVFAYTVPGPAGFTKVESNDPNTHVWTKKRPGRAVQSEYKVTLRKAGPMPEHYLPNGGALEASGLTFRQVRVFGIQAQFTQTVSFSSRDGDCLITITATRDESDADAAAAMTNAAKKIAAKR